MFLSAARLPTALSKQLHVAVPSIACVLELWIRALVLAQQALLCAEPFFLSPPQTSWCLSLEAQSLLPSFWVRYLICSLSIIIFYAIVQYKDLGISRGVSSLPFPLPTQNPTHKQATTFWPFPLNLFNAISSDPTAASHPATVTPQMDDITPGLTMTSYLD